MNALVLYVGTQAISYIQSKSGATSISTITHSSHMDIFQNLAVDLDTEGFVIILVFCNESKQYLSIRKKVLLAIFSYKMMFSMLFFSIGRYLYLNAIANQLRYPNSHTHYFSCTLLYLFAEANSEAIQEQITR